MQRPNEHAARGGLAGVLRRLRPAPGRFRALEGLAPYWFELEPTLYLSQEGHVSAQLEVEYELLLTQRLVLQPRFEASVAIQDDPKLGVGSGLGDVELSARLRYEIVRELAPYLGVAWHRRVGDTADLARAAGKYVSNVSLVVGGSIVIPHLRRAVDRLDELRSAAAS